METPPTDRTRRELLKGMATLSVLPAVATAGQQDQTSPLIEVPNKEGKVNRTSGDLHTRDGAVLEHARNLPTDSASEVIVCGGGPAGVAAALASARQGAKTLLIEVHGCLGGVWTAGMLCNILDAGSKSGIMREIETRLEEAGNQPPTRKFTYNPEAMKRVLEEMCVEAGVRIRCQTRVVGAIRSGSTLAAILTESKAGREAWTAETFIDCTGDGDLGAHAGCAFDVGIDESCTCQPMSLMALVSGLDAEAIGPYINAGGTDAKRQLLQLLQDHGCHPSYASPSLFHIQDNLFALMANHEYGVSAFDPDAVTEATIRARKEVNRIVDTLRGVGGAWKDVALVATAEQIGIREGRRIQGRYVVTEQDLVEGKEHKDAVCKVKFPVDVHTLTNEVGKTKGYSNHDIEVKPYDIPLRALISKDVDNLLMAGRCISGDFFAHASYRVTGNAVPMGEAAGKLAADCVAKGKRAHEVVGG
ncbi:MAG: FAD-dependent oxidoreductase [Candidatus Omnitrophica bacterium]|nr:FAD-dependent oxidoreductase [Candidatus Omnitrophota bacterium]MCB9768166.1 FAD-dependent oxidoreductase [Candidatus Omnitrophota bacterium]